MGMMLEVDLSEEKVSETWVDKTTCEQFVGSSGLAAKIFFDRRGYLSEPLSSEALLIFMTGPFSGARLDGASRCSVAGRSPLTGIWGEASCGGNFGPWVRFAGYDGIIITGKARTPVYLIINDGDAQIKDASHLWGKDAYETVDILKQAHRDPKVRVVAIGNAGENLVRYANITNDKAHFFGRAGFGALMGSKNLKAIAVGASKREVPIAHAKEFEQLRKTLRPRLLNFMTSQILHELGTAGSFEALSYEGDVPCKNWTLPSWEEASSKLTGDTLLKEKYITGVVTCWWCGLACKRLSVVSDGPYATPEGPGMQYETVAGFGPLVLNDNPAVIVKAGNLCNRYGMDTISCSATIAWAMECFEKGYLTKEDTGGLELKWGDGDTIVRLVEQIAKRQGIGNLLAEGSAAAAAKLGPETVEFTVCVKGLEAPNHEPRFMFGLGPAYATSIRGACHVSSTAVWVEWGGAYYPEIGVDKLYVYRSNEDKAELASKCCDVGQLINSSGLCLHLAGLLVMTELVELFNVVTDSGWDIPTMMSTGERIWYLKRSLGHLMGMTAKDDQLPQRLARPLEAGPYAGNAPDMARLMREFYEMKEIDSVTGKPSRRKLEELGLKEVADAIL